MIIDINKLKFSMNIYRRYYFWRKEKTIFVHVPKVAGTSINYALFGKTLGHYQANYIKKKFPKLFKNSFVFSFVRNPWDRVYSAYKFACIGNTESMGVRNPAQYAIPEFSSFERFLKEWLIKQDVSRLDFIFRPQYLFLTDKAGNILPDFIGKLENINQDILVIEKELNKKLDIKRVNQTNNASLYEQAYLDDEMISIVKNIYKKDIDLFNYDFR